MDEITKLAFDAFKKNPDGDWVSVKNSDLNTKSNKVIRVPPGMTFKKGGTFLGFDIVQVLEYLSAHPELLAPKEPKPKK
jgi:hypothetical protein